MANELRTEVEQVKQQEDVKRALKMTSTVKTVDKPKAETKDKLLLGTHVVIVLALAALHPVLQFNFPGFAARYIPSIVKLNQSVMAVVLLLAIAKVVDVYVIGRIDSPVSRYNLRRVALVKRHVVKAIKETAEALGNTPAVRRSAYICPLIMSSFEKGEVIDRHFVSVRELMSYRGVSLHPAERALLRLLKKQSSS
jgi:hypothetical protein